MEVAKDGSKKTQIMYKANLSFKQANKYLSFLVEETNLLYNQGDGRDTIFKTSEKGKKFIKEYKNFCSTFL